MVSVKACLKYPLSTRNLKAIAKTIEINRWHILQGKNLYMVLTIKIKPHILNSLCCWDFWVYLWTVFCFLCRMDLFFGSTMACSSSVPDQGLKAMVVKSASLTTRTTRELQEWIHFKISNLRELPGGLLVWIFCAFTDVAQVQPLVTENSFGKLRSYKTCCVARKVNWSQTE